jgi:anti-sigma factor RsiW
MTAETHPVEREQLMAYLDGELAADAATRVAAHIKECADCRQLEADLLSVSNQMLSWSVEPASPQLSENVLAELHTVPNERVAKEMKNRTAESAHLRRMRWGKWVLTAACATVAVLILLKMRAPSSTSELDRLVLTSKVSPAPSESLKNSPTAGGGGGGNHDDKWRAPAAQESAHINETIASAAKVRAEMERRKSEVASMSSNLNGASVAPPSRQASQPQAAANFGGLLKESNADDLTVPAIARTASLKISVKDFASARAGVDRIIDSFHGYAATMTINSATGEPQSLSAELHIPSTRSDAALTALKALGRVEQEQQGGEEVTAQIVDLDARLKNARVTETRLQDILKTRTGKVTDVLEVEREIAEVRGSIEQMEGEQKQLNTRVSFSTITLDLHEEYQATLDTNAPSAGRRIRNAFVDGYRAAAEGSLSLLVFLLNAGPTLILTAVILFWPVRWAWRRFGNRPRHEAALAR